MDPFESKGYDAVSIRALTRAVGIKESSFYNHYPGKASLLEEIFSVMEKELGKNKLNAMQIDRFTDDLSLKEYMERGIDRFMQRWNEPYAAKIWAIVSMEQYRNKKAAELIIKESERTINNLSTAFLFFQQKRKMREGDPFLLANLYGFSIRAIHLDYSLRSFTDLDAKYSLNKMYETAELFANTYSK